MLFKKKNFFLFQISDDEDDVSVYVYYSIWIGRDV